MQFIKKHLFTILAAVVAAFMVIFASRFVGNSGKVLDVVLFAFFGTVLLVTPAMAMCSEILERLKALEPKMDFPAAYSPPSDSYSPRRDLEHSLVHSLSAGLLDRDLSGKEIGAFIKAVADSMLNSGLPVEKTLDHCGQCGLAVCSDCDKLAGAKRALDSATQRIAEKWAGSVEGANRASTPIAAFKASVEHFVGRHQSDGCAAGRVTMGDMEPLSASAGAQADQRAEAEIVAAGLTEPRVTAPEIQALMDKLTWRYEQPGGTTSTFAHAFLGRFYLASGHSACVSPENFNAELGKKYAREQGEGKARDELWKLEGYALAKALKVAGS